MYSSKILFLFIGFLFLISFSDHALSQYCIGATEYRVRRPNGKELTEKRFKKLRILSIDGAPREITDHADGRTGIYYEINGKNRFHEIKKKNRVSFIFLPCGQIGDMSLEYDGIVMNLLFGVEIYNSNFLIQALPFQGGTFRLTNLKCIDGNPPPRVDNENRGFCIVPSSAWEKIEDETEVEADSPIRELLRKYG
ncbi:MAG: hypothetical protein HKN33_12330 [Pyrinomonadaceae bacterium]|nr:hypothetical protein [Pyrinomonadaceae bacterium]